MTASKRPGANPTATAQLWQAIGRHDERALQAAWAKGGDPKARGTNTLYGRETMLQRAASLGDEVAVRFLMARGASQAAGRHGHTPLIALACALPKIPESHATACLDLLLARRPNLFVRGGEQGKTVGSALFHLFVSPAEHAPRVRKRFIDHMAQRRLVWSEEASIELLSGAFHFGTPAEFEALLAMGADIRHTGARAAGLAYRLLAPVHVEHTRNPEEWWEVLARHNAPIGQGGPGVDPTLAERAQAEISRRRAAQAATALERTLVQALPPGRRMRM